MESSVCRPSCLWRRILMARGGHFRGAPEGGPAGKSDAGNSLPFPGLQHGESLAGDDAGAIIETRYLRLINRAPRHPSSGRNRIRFLSYRFRKSVDFKRD